MQATYLEPKKRIESIDILRGAIMLIMALDHARDFYHIQAFTGNPLDLQTTTPALFFTRWITHFCAPIFVFLSGLSAYLVGLRKSKKELSEFLLKRGAWLLLAEVTLVTLGWTFNPLYNLFILQVIWAIGWSMIIIGLLVRTSFTVIAALGFIILLAHNLLDYVTIKGDDAATIATRVLMIANYNIYNLGGNRFVIDVYAILPWTGIMCLGYATGSFYKSSVSEQQRRKKLITTGLIVLAAFIALRFINKYGDPLPWSPQKNAFYTFLSFINVNKYPPSLLYACLTVGPAIILLAFLEKIKNAFTNILSVYGSVPFFYYVLHIYLIHIILVILFFANGYHINQAVDLNTPFLFRPQKFGVSLPIVYLLWFIVIFILYFPSKWYKNYKATHRQWWLSYI